MKGLGSNQDTSDRMWGVLQSQKGQTQTSQRIKCWHKE